MSLYYCPANQSFYDTAITDTIPLTAIPITAEQHAVFLAALNNNSLILHDATIPDGYVITPPRPSPHHQWDAIDQQWDLPPEAAAALLAESKATAAESIDDAAIAALAKPARFAAEYQLRESEAQAFAAHQYQGEAPLQVAAFANAAGLDSQTATNIILQQAVQLREALAQIGALRMRKFELNSLKTATEVATRAADIIAAIDAIGIRL